ncbi:hypothetical protein [Rubrivivax gelatinosus]|uniref:hypothetical protein n=1 Tax=Rubrivivax gelatinosus TaxID=28068 RepID=UPI0012FD17D4|nr:hypothetical protein [Rubrivivax gelatinosus]MBG6083221.1 hypothetical protein [Rubrivivax gelatinosus]
MTVRITIQITLVIATLVVVRDPGASITIAVRAPAVQIDAAASVGRSVPIGEIPPRDDRLRAAGPRP